VADDRGMFRSRIPRTLLRGAAAAGLTLLATAGAAHAGPPGTWTQVTGRDGGTKTIDEVGLERTGDGVLHVLWTHEPGAGPATVRHSAVAADTKALSGPDQVLQYSGGVNNSVDLVAGPGGGLRAFFAGIGGSLTERLATATAGADGKTWTVQPSPASKAAGGKPVYAANGIGATLGLDGMPFAAWGDSAPGANGLHAGLDAHDPDQQLAGATPVDPTVAVDSRTGHVVAAWNSLDGGNAQARGVAPAGAPVAVPASGARQLGQRVSATGRIGGDGVWIAYSAGENEFLGRPAVWRFGAPQPKVLSRATGARFTGVAAAPGGRLWVFWARRDTLLATRSNATVTRFGRTVSLTAPKGTSSIFSLNGEGSQGPLDLLALVQKGGVPGYWHQRVLPGLTLTARKKTGGKVAFKVTDAAEPVKGAKIALGKGSKLTSANGTATFAIAPGHHEAKAGKVGYAPDSVRVRVK
jgi:hypothetical protein